MSETISWIATVATIVAASMTAANLGSRITGYGFCVFLLGSVCWFTAGLLSSQPALVWTNAMLTVLNAFGIWRWLGRQAKLDEGAAAASEASDRTPGESLFPVSLLLNAPIEDHHGSRLGNCVNAMTGCSSGRLSYVVASEGGIGGVGEALRKLPWEKARFDSDRLIVEGFADLPAIEKDEWPAR